MFLNNLLLITRFFLKFYYKKIIGRYSNYLPWKVFSCINIRSYYITEIEAKLLNEINSYHSEFYFGTELFTCKDVVVCLSDVGILHKFLETSRSVFENGLDSCAFLGFIEITNPKSVLPYIAKEVNLTDEELAKQDQQKIHQNSKDEIQLDQIFPDLFGGMSESKNADEDNHEPDAQTRSASNGHNHNDDDQDQLDRPLTIESNDKVTSPALESANPVIEAASSTQAQKSNGNTDRPRPNKCPELSSLLADDDVIVCSAEVQKRKCVPRSLIEGHNIDDDRIESLQMTEWDASYLKMICIYAGFDQLISLMGKVVVNNSTGGTAKPSDDLCRLDSLYSQSDQQPVEFTEHQIAHVNANLAMPINSNQSEINNRYACVQQNLGATNSATVYANSLNRMQPSVSSFATSKAPTVVAPLTNAASIQNPIPPQLQNSILQPHHHLPTNPLLMNTNRVYKTQTSQQQPPRPVAYVSSSRVRPLPPPPLGSTGSFGQQGVYNQVYQTQDQLASSSTSLNNAQISNRQISPAQPTPNHLHHRSNSSSSLIRSSGSQAAVVPKNQRQLYDNGLGATLTNQNRPVMPLVSPAIAQSTTNGLAPRSMSLSHRTSTHNSISNNTATSNNNQNSNTNLGHEIDLFNHLCALLPENLSGLNNHNLSQQQQQQPQSQGQQLNSLRNQSIVSNNVSNSVTPNDNNNMNWLNNFLNNGAAFRSVNSSSTTTTNSSSNSNRTQPVAQIDANQLLSDLLTRTNGLVTQQMQQNPQAAALTAQRNAYNAGQSLASNLSRWNGMASTSNPNISTASTAPALNHHLSSQPNDATQSLHQSNSSGAVVRSDSTDATHRIYRVEVGGCTLRAINLFPDSSLLVVLVGEIAQKILTGVTYFNLTKILVNVFEFQLFDISKYVSFFSFCFTLAMKLTIRYICHLQGSRSDVHPIGLQTNCP